MTLTERDNPTVTGRRKVLLLHSSDPGTSLLKEILSRHVDITCACDIPGMQSLLAESSFDLLFSDWRFVMGTWRDVVEGVHLLYPDLPVIVVCRAGGEKEWRETLDEGAFDLLSEPYSELAVLSVVEHGLASRDARAVRSAA